MTGVRTRIDGGHLVPLARFGALLHQRRVAVDASLSSLARGSEQRWLPDELLAIERGSVPLDDAEIVALADLYALPHRPLCPPAELQLVLDRASSEDFGTPQRTPAVPGEQFAVAVSSRFIALAVILGLDALSGPPSMDVLAEFLGVPTPSAVEAVHASMGDGESRLAQIIDEMGEQVVVPEVGLLIGGASVGTLVLAGRRRVTSTALHGRYVPPAGGLRDLVEASRFGVSAEAQPVENGPEPRN